jgi:Fis family transcriptional regulator
VSAINLATDLRADMNDMNDVNDLTDGMTDTMTASMTVESSLPQPVLSKSVEIAVENYFDSMDDQAITDLYEMVLSEVEAPLLSCVLRHTGNNQSHTAQILGLNRGTLRKKLKKYGML